MATVGTRNKTLRDFNAGLKGDKTHDSAIVDLVVEANPILDDIPVFEANDGQNDRTTIRTGLPTATWTSFYEGVQPDKGSKAQVSNSCGRLESMIQVDKALLEIAPDSQAEMLDEAFAHAESMGMEIADAILYGDVRTNAKKFNGLAPVYSSYGGTDNKLASFYCIQSAARSQSPSNTNLRSIFLVGWGRQGAYGFYPRGSKGGIKRGPLEDQTVSLSTGNRLKVKEQSFEWYFGLTVKDFRTCGRICNIESNNLSTLDKDLGEDMLKLWTRCRRVGVSQVWYMPQTVYEWLCIKTRKQVIATSFTFKDVSGVEVLHFMGTPIRILECMETNETAVASV